MLCDLDHQIELVIPYDSSDKSSCERRYLGSMVHWGDDPDMTRFDYELPRQFWFMDARGFVSLNGIRSRTVEPTRGWPYNLQPVSNRHRLRGVRRGTRRDYSTVNGLTTRIEGLGRWFGHRSIRNNLRSRPRSTREFSLTITPPQTERLDAGLNLSIVAGADWRLPGEPGLTHLEEIGSIRTTMQRGRPWAEHIERHRAVHKLLEISAWKSLGFHQANVMHRRDPERVLSGEKVGDRWAPVKTYSLTMPKNDGRAEFLFTYQDIEAAGVRRWLRLRDEFQSRHSRDDLLNPEWRDVP